MRYGIGITNNQRTQFGTTNEHGYAQFELIACGKSQLTMKRWSCDRPATFDMT